MIGSFNNAVDKRNAKIFHLMTRTLGMNNTKKIKRVCPNDHGTVPTVSSNKSERHESPIFLRVFDVFDGLGQRLASFLQRLRLLKPSSQGFAGSLRDPFAEYGG